MAERRHEARAQVDLAVQVSGNWRQRDAFHAKRHGQQYQQWWRTSVGAVPGNTVGRLALGSIPAAEGSIQDRVGKGFSV